ncbi:HAUS augmin-like complex subunit 6 isoform X2 [Caloenas nicobarica]|uniref:HAUS augmin-like complex subunit 6 isoform X2 n=1 Tax=Caloenas nicobarica TaxID=187106 RepID=UPI0032B7F59C
MYVEWEGDHLCLYVLALGFDLQAVDSYGLELEAKMFDVPNNSAFQAIALFLFNMLDQSRAKKAFRDCSFPVGALTDPEFRKQCYLWLKDISSLDQSCLPQVAPSAFLSPAGPKCIHLLYQFARYVMVEDVKRNCQGTDISFAETVNLRPKDMYMANARCRVAYNKLLQIFQKEDFVLQEYEKKSQLLIEDIRALKDDCASLQIQSCKMKQSDQTENDKTERIQKVRSMWTAIMEVLTSLKKEKEVVDSVLQGCVGQYILDGTDVAFRVPQLLVHRVESDVHQLCTGNLYKDGKLNFLMVLQLLNEALRTLRDEHGASELKQQLEVTENIMLHSEVLHDLKAKMLKREQQNCVSTSGSFSGKERDWEVKWKNYLGQCPFNLILSQDPELDLRASLFRDFYSEEGDDDDDDDDDSVFCQYLVSVSDVRDSIHEVHDEKDHGALETVIDKSTPPQRCPQRSPSVHLELSKASKSRDVLLEKKLNIETCKKEKPVSPKILKNGTDESAISEMSENGGDDVIQMESPVKKKDPLDEARDQLAEQVAKAVASESPQSGEGKGMALEDLINLLAFNPFLTRKQIPRTPENLLTEIRSSWRKAVETEDSSDIELTPTEVMTEEAPVTQRVADSIPASSVPDLDPPLSERKASLSSTELRPQEQMSISCVAESALSETSGMRESKSTLEEEELTYIVLNKSSVEDREEQTFQYVEKSMNTPSICSEDNSRMNDVPLDHVQGSLKDLVLHRVVCPLSGSVSPQAASVGILGETLPEELCNIDSELEGSFISNFDVIDSTYVTGDPKNKEDIQKSKLDSQSLFNTCKALRNTSSNSEEELHQTHNGDEFVSCRSDLSLAPEKRERDELCSPLEFCLDEEFTKTPLSVSPNDRKYSLSSLLVSCQRLEEMLSMVHEIPVDLIRKLNDVTIVHTCPSGPTIRVRSHVCCQSTRRNTPFILPLVPEAHLSQSKCTRWQRYPWKASRLRRELT